MYNDASWMNGMSNAVRKENTRQQEAALLNQLSNAPIMNSQVGGSVDGLNALQISNMDLYNRMLGLRAQAQINTNQPNYTQLLGGTSGYL